MSPDDVRERIDRLADRAADKRYLADRRWRGALHAVPRHLFVPERGWAVPDVGGEESYPIDRDADPATWWDAVYAEAGIIVQTDDGATDPFTGEGAFTSSLSAPSVVCAFLDQLYVHDHHRVLEVGTGTGWTAGLLSYRLGAGNVTSVEVDDAVAKRAADNLEAAGFAPTLITGDGAEGAPGGAPYDRMHVTCGVTDIPYAWIDQTRPGGVIVLPWMPNYAGGHRLRLSVLDDGTAVGRFNGDCAYMMLRSQRFPSMNIDENGAEARRSTTRVAPRSVAWDSLGADVAIAALLPDVVSADETGADGSFTLRLRETNGPSRATATFRPGRDAYDVREYGDRRLWREVVRAYMSWLSWGRPDRDRFGVTVTPDGQYLWLDAPGNVVE